MTTDRRAAAEAVNLTSAGMADAGIPGRLPLPAGVILNRIEWGQAAPILFYHLVALLAFLPWTFSWTGVIVAVIVARLSGLLGINIGYHRLLTHRGFRCPKWFEHVLVVIAICCVEDTPARWVAVHRRHHQHADEQPDPHSPLVNFLWGHVGWLVVKNPELNRLGIYDRYAKDILRDPFYVALERNWLQLKIILIQWAVFFGAGVPRRTGAGRYNDGGRAVRNEHPDLGRVRAHGVRLAPDLGGEFRDSSLGLPELPNR